MRRHTEIQLYNIQMCAWALAINLNSSKPSAAYVRQWMASSLVLIMDCRLFGAKPLSEPMLVYCQKEPWEQTSVKFESKYTTIALQKMQNVVCKMTVFRLAFNMKFAHSNVTPQETCARFALYVLFWFVTDRYHWNPSGLIASMTPGDRWIPHTNGQKRGKCFHLMTSSCKSN